MSQVGNNEQQFGGRYLIQEQDHMVGVTGQSESVQPVNSQAVQSQPQTRQPGVEQSKKARKGGVQHRQNQ